ncbi:hypothetical protein EV208_12113 [Christensenella hongkongensis]|nr:hypothetical protein EV208_12113 [Christensenella hongkongensis]
MKIGKGADMEEITYEESKLSEIIMSTAQAAYRSTTNKDSFSFICPFCSGKVNAVKCDLISNYIRIKCSKCDVDFSFDPTQKLEYYYD